MVLDTIKSAGNGTTLDSEGRLIVSIANYLTFIRILMSPLFLLIYLEYETFNINLVSLPYILLFLIALLELSDACDGYFARKYNEVTDLGKILDPMADSIYRNSVFLTFTLPPISLPMILVFIFIYRDSIVSTLRTICAFQGFALAARPSGKLKAIIQAFSAIFILLLLIPYSLGHLSESNLHFTATMITAFAALYSLTSGMEYIYANRHYVIQLLRTKKKASFSKIDL